MAAKQILLGKVVQLQSKIDAITIPLDHELALTRGWERANMILTGWTAQLGILIEELSHEIRVEQETIRADEAFKRFYEEEIQRKPKRDERPPEDDEHGEGGGLMQGM